MIDPSKSWKPSPQALVAKGIEVDAMHPDGVSALMYAAAGGHPEVVSFLLGGKGQAKADPNLKHVQGGTALMEAATSGSQEVVDLLLAAGADPMVRDKDGVSPLMSAAAQVCGRLFFLSPCVCTLKGTSMKFNRYNRRKREELLPLCANDDLYNPTLIHR